MLVLAAFGRGFVQPRVATERIRPMFKGRDGDYASAMVYNRIIRRKPGREAGSIGTMARLPKRSAKLLLAAVSLSSYEDQHIAEELEPFLHHGFNQRRVCRPV